MARFGFTATELDRQKQAVLRGYERVVAEVDNIVSASRADEYVRNFTQNETLPSPNEEFAMHQRFLPQITLDEVNRMAREWFPDQNRLVIVSAPEKSGLVVPDEQQLAAVVKAAASRGADRVRGHGQRDGAARGGPPARDDRQDHAIEADGITEWQLSNGVKVVLKPTTFKEDEVIFRATSPGGTSLASDQDFIPASTATQVVTAGGVGKFNSVDMRKMLTGKAASANPFIGELEEGLTGGGSRKDLETMFQLIYLSFTQPRRDETAFAALTSQMKSLLANQSASPDFALASTLAAAMYQNHVRRRPQTLDDGERVEPRQVAGVLQGPFCRRQRFHVRLRRQLRPGDDEAAGRALSRQPAVDPAEGNAGRTSACVRRPASSRRRSRKGIEPKSQVAIVFTGPFEYDEAHRLTIRAMAHMLQGNLLQAIREDLGGTYSITASPNFSGFRGRSIPSPSVSAAIRSAPMICSSGCSRRSRSSRKMGPPNDR